MNPVFRVGGIGSPARGVGERGRDERALLLGGDLGDEVLVGEALVVGRTPVVAVLLVVAAVDAVQLGRRRELVARALEGLDLDAA